MGWRQTGQSSSDIIRDKIAVEDDSSETGTGVGVSSFAVWASSTLNSDPSIKSKSSSNPLFIQYLFSLL